MISHRDGYTSWLQAIRSTSKNTNSSSDLAAHIKAGIDTLAPRGLFAVAVSNWLILQGGLRDE